MCLSVALIVHLNATEELLQWPVLCIELHVPSLFQGCLFFLIFCSCMLSTLGHWDAALFLDWQGEFIWLEFALKNLQSDT